MNTTSSSNDIKPGKKRDIIVKQDQIEQYAQQPSNPSSGTTSPDPFCRFLWHEPLQVQNPYYAKILNQCRAGWLQASMVLNPIPGPQDSDRFNTAVDVCRTHAALGDLGVIGPAWQSLFYAGLAFGGRNNYPKECDWIFERLKGIAATFPILAPIMEMMPQVWNRDRVHWNAFGSLMPELFGGQIV